MPSRMQEELQKKQRFQFGVPLQDIEPDSAESGRDDLLSDTPAEKGAEKKAKKTIVKKDWKKRDPLSDNPFIWQHSLRSPSLPNK